MAKEMLINVSAGEECRIALLEDGKLDELYMERTSNTSHVGNIYKGKVTNVEPSIQAAFVDFGIGRNGFLHISDLMPTYFGKKGADAPAEKVGQKLGRRDRPPIQQCLRKGDEIVVQIIKEGIGTKGPTLSTYLSVPGRVLVMMPGMSKMGVSKKIEDEEERSRLRKILDGLVPPKDCGFIIRTAGIGKSKLEIEKDLKYLARLWDVLKKQIEKDKPPVELYTEGDLITRTVRDVFTSDVEKIVVDDKETAKKIKDFIKLAMPRTKNKVELYEDVVPLFHKYELEERVESINSRRVPLPSGGSLVIDQTEAIVAIDVNSGKFRDHSDAEETAFRTDLEAADEIPRQLRLRDMGGVIICDFIDLRYERHRRELEERIFKNLQKDRAKTRMLRMSQFGIVEMTRQRMRPSLKKAIYHECTSCQGHGLVKSPESMALDVMRKLRVALNDAAVVRAILTVHPDVAEHLQNKKRYEIAKLEQVTEKRVAIASDAEMSSDETKFELYDSRDGYIYIAELGMALPASQHQRQQGDDGRRGRDRGRDRRRDEQPKAKHDRRDDNVEADELIAEEPVEKPAKADKPDAKPARTSRAKKADADEIEQTGNDDEAGVVDVDEGGDEMPGHAPGGFFEPGQGDRRGNRDGGRDRSRGRDRNRNDRNNRGDNAGRGGNRNDNAGRNNGRGDDAGRNENRDDIAARGGNAARSDNAARGDNRGPNAEARGNDRRGPSAPTPAEDADTDAIEPADDFADVDNMEGEAFAGNADAAGTAVDENAQTGETGEDGLPREGGRRRRRRRGRRGRGRAQQQGEGQPGEPNGDAPSAEAPTPAQPDASRNANRDGGRDPNRVNDRDPNRVHDRDAGRDSNRDSAPRDAGGQGSQQQRPRRDPPRQDPRHGQNQGKNRDTRRGSNRADLSGLARDEARRDEARRDVEEKRLDDPDYTPGNDVNYVAPKPKEVPGRGPRGGRRQRGRTQTAAKRTPPIEGLPDDDELDREAAELEARLAKKDAPKAKPSPRSSKPIERPDVKPTGSSDSHLADDDPADGEDVRPPSSYGDLDALPDYDDD